MAIIRLRDTPANRGKDTPDNKGQDTQVTQATQANKGQDTQASNPLAIMANNQVAMLHHQHQALRRMLNECLALLILIVREKLQQKNCRRLYKMAKARIFQTNVVKYLFVSFSII